MLPYTRADLNCISDDSLGKVPVVGELNNSGESIKQVYKDLSMCVASIT